MSGAANEDQHIAPDTLRSLSVAPRQRSSAPAHDDVACRWPNESPVNTETTGSHAASRITVADLITKIGAPTLERSSHSYATRNQDPDIAPSDASDVFACAPGYLDNEQDTQVIDIPLELVSEIPDLQAAHYPHDNVHTPTPSHEVLPVPSGVASAFEALTSREQQPKSSHGPIVLAGRTLSALVAVLALALTGAAWQWNTSKNNRFNTVNALDPGSHDIVDIGGQYGDENFLIVGMDSRAGANVNIGAGDTQDVDGIRSDAVMLVNIPANRKRVVVISFPRDLAITPIQCEVWDPETGKYGPIYNEKKGKFGPRVVYTETKLNSTFSYGGLKCLVKEIQKLSGLSINRFIATDFVGFARMVEAVGGVEVCSKTPIQDYELGTLLDHSGRQVLNGVTALNYVRARKVATEVNGDYGRIKRQQLFLSSLLRSMISTDTLFNLNKLNNVANIFIGNSYVDNVKTKDLVQLGRSLQGLAAEHITFVTVPTGVTDANGDEPPRTADMRALFDSIVKDDPLPLENDQNAQSLGMTPATAPTSNKATPDSPTPEVKREQVTTTSPQSITVQVSNSTTRTGLAAIAANELEQAGFNVMTPDDYSSSLKVTTVFFSPGNKQAAATMASAFPNSKVQRVTGIGQIVRVVLGPDFNAVSTPPPSGTSVTVQIDRNSNSPPTRLPEDLTVTNATDITCG
ncbi:LCP family protein [Mycobacterium uberis]|uniref:LCP family protein n=1 Tax=Mycobacterium uberis TaxID=2162698 RepID=UPI003C735635